MYSDSKAENDNQPVYVDGISMYDTTLHESFFFVSIK